MFKRANKVTALLVAAASIMSVVPAMAADTTRLGNKEGTIKQGIAFEEGKYGYYGYRTDDDDTGIWFNKGGEAKDSYNDDLEDYRFDNISKYGEKYAYAKESSNDDEYLVDLTTGKVVDDETAEEKLDTAQAKLATNLKKASRYEDFVTRTADLDGGVEQILTGQFGEVWYQFTTGTGANYKTGFTNETGKYVDASYLANMKVFSTYTGRAEMIKEYGTEGFDKDTKLQVDLVEVSPIAQDKDYIYVVTEVAVVDTNATPGIAVPTTQYFLQKIAKAQGSKDADDAYVPKSVTSYQLQTGNTVATGKIYNNEDITKAYDDIMTSTATKKLVGIAVKDNAIYVTRAEDDKVYITKLLMKKIKEEVVVGNTLNKDVDTYAVVRDGDTDNGDIISHSIVASDEDAGLQGFEDTGIDIAGQDVYRHPSISIDVNGNTWVLEKGKIVKYTGTDSKDLYTVDRSLNALDVYNDDSLIAWDTDGDVYTNIVEGHKTTVDDAVVVDPTLGTPVAATVGWKQEAAGWTFYDVNGAKTASKWVIDNGTWYYIKADGIMATGWYNDNGTWYFLKASGAMATGWYNDNGTWYYLAASGAMLANTTVDGYVLGASGAWVK